MMRILGTIFAALLGLAFGSFLNVCVSRWPAGESIVEPRSHCRSCGKTLSWNENLPLASWIALRGRCQNCGAWIGWRYPLVELAVGGTWAVCAWQALPVFDLPGWTTVSVFDAVLFGVERMVLCWLLVTLAALDAEHLWLPDKLTLGGAALGLCFNLTRFTVHWIWVTVPMHWDMYSGFASHRAHLYDVVLRWLFGILVAPALILLIRWTYRLVRRREGVGLGDVKLMLMLAVWLGLSHTLLAFVVGVALGAVVAVVMLVRGRKGGESVGLMKLPFGTFLCVGGIVSGLWGDRLIAAYLGWAGF